MSFILNACDNSTYLSKLSFPTMKIQKSKYGSSLAYKHLTDSMRVAIAKYTPNYNKKLKRCCVKYHAEFHNFLHMDCLSQRTLHIANHITFFNKTKQTALCNTCIYYLLTYGFSAFLWLLCGFTCLIFLW